MRPTKEDLQAAAGRTVADVIAYSLDVLLVGINPGLYSAWAGHHFARPGNRFWPALYGGGFTPRLLRPEEELELLVWGVGITNIAARATTAAHELTAAELVEGGRSLEAKVREYAPGWVGVLGIGAYRTAFGRPKAALGPQPEGLAGARLWVLPNPSGLNAYYDLEGLAALFGELREAVRGEG